MKIWEIHISGHQRGLTFSSAHLIPGHEKCGRIHGHTYAVSVYLKGEPGEDYMLEDFGRLKSTMRDIISELDHRFLLPGEYPGLELRMIGPRERPEAYEFTFCDDLYVFPARDVAVLPIPSTTSEMLASYILGLLAPHYLSRPGLLEIGVMVEEGPGQGSWCRMSPDPA